VGAGPRFGARGYSSPPQGWGRRYLCPMAAVLPARDSTVAPNGPSKKSQLCCPYLTLAVVSSLDGACGTASRAVR
jgi:hypothetical protein